MEIKMAPAGAFFISGVFGNCLFFAVDRADAVDDLQVVVLCEVEHEAVSHWLEFAEATIDEYGFFAVIVAGANVRGVFHLAFCTEGGHDAAQAFGPVAGAKLSSFLGEANNDECGRF